MLRDALLRSAPQHEAGGDRRKLESFFVMSDSIVTVCSTSAVAENSAKSFNIGGEFFATDNECTHGAASLADGILEDDIIECALHFGAFNVKTGEAVQAPCFTALRTYKVMVEGGQVKVDLDKTATD